MQKKKCSDVIFGCPVCASSLQCYEYNDKNLLVNKFTTKRGDEYLFCTNEILYQKMLPDGT